MATQNRKSSSGRGRTTKSSSASGKKTSGKKSNGKNNRKESQGPDLLTIIVVLIAVVLVVVVNVTKEHGNGDLVKGFENIKTTATNIFNNLKTSVSNAWNKIKEAITKPIDKAKEKVKAAIDKIKSIVSGVKLELPHFKLPHFSVSGGQAPFGIGGKGSLPHFSVDWRAKGGIFDSESIIGYGVGEKGAEAIVPLDRFWNKLDKIADNSSSGDTNNITINVQASPGMNTRELAAEVERRLINSTNRRRLAW